MTVETFDGVAVDLAGHLTTTELARLGYSGAGVFYYANRLALAAHREGRNIVDVADHVQAQLAATGSRLTDAQLEHVLRRSGLPRPPALGQLSLLA